MIPATVTVPAGSFQMGGRPGDKFVGRSEKPLTPVTFAHPFELGTFPVTEAQFAAFDPSYPTSSLPVVNVSWMQAQDYCQWLSGSIGKRVRLPSEQEWEYACRAGSDFIFQRGDVLELADACFLYDESGNRVGRGSRSPQGDYPANAFGLCEMLGNVCEWTQSSWTETLDADAPANEGRKVIRGGAWDYLPRLLRTSWRDSFPPAAHRDNIGFRILIES